MIYEPPETRIGIPETNQEAVDEIVSQGPGGALAVAGTAVLIVLAIWFAFYFFVFIPRT
ncbi:MULTISPECIES: hypothetical protein [Noviherbaspirillum]|uniref:hypothetical protein n=1 Tax=Noviherbaspirillum TaxID=1344552 RepID=UPI00178C54C2|nr:MULTISPECIES: hypothetical protein [Noviherbaspirillum]